jgi:uncharacterized protein YndB with AHSA1/START domain
VAVLNVLIDRDPKQVWDVLSDGWAYAEWVVGTKDIREVDRDWPAEGSQIHYTVGFGAWTVEDVTTVRLVETGRRLELEANAGWVGSARVSISLLPWGTGQTLVIIDEHPLTGAVCPPPPTHGCSLADGTPGAGCGEVLGVRSGTPQRRPRRIGAAGTVHRAAGVRG